MKRRFHLVAPVSTGIARGTLANQRICKRIREVFGWIKQSAGLRQAMRFGIARTSVELPLAGSHPLI